MRYALDFLFLKIYLTNFDTLSIRCQIIELQKKVYFCEALAICEKIWSRKRCLKYILQVC